MDSATLRYVVLERGLGLSREELEGDAITYAEDAELTVREVLVGSTELAEVGRQRLAFLLNPTPVDVNPAVADAGEGLPQKRPGRAAARPYRVETAYGSGAEPAGIATRNKEHECLVACCLFLVPCSLLLVACCLFLVPCSFFLVPEDGGGAGPISVPGGR